MKALFLIAFSITVFTASSQDTLKTLNLREVVVTGEVEPQSIQKSVYNVRVIPMERLKNQGALKLQDVLNTELNIRFSQDLALGGSNLSMQGLPGQNVKILIDGVPLIGRQGTGNEVNINQVNVNAIERIEIVEGPMSVVYGADALAGVINIITKKATENKIELNATVHEETAGNEYGVDRGMHNAHINAAYAQKSLYATGYVARNGFRGWKGDSTEREKEWHPKMQWMGGGLLGFRNDKINAYYRVDNLYEKIYNPAQYQGNEAIDQNYITNRLMQQLQVSASFSEKVNLNSALAYTTFGRKTQSISVDKVSGRETLAAASLQDNNKFNGLTWRGTLQFKATEALSLQSGYDINVENGTGGRLKAGINSINDYAAFLAADLKMVSFLSIRPGVRVIRNSAYEAPPVIPSINTRITLTENHDLRFSYGRGFRAPSLRELYFNFYDASHSIEGNPDLKAELSHSLNASWNGRILQTTKLKFNTTASLFYNTVENLIDYGVRPNSTVTTYINIDSYKSKGVTWTNTLRTKKIEASAGFAYTARYNEFTTSDGNLPEYMWSPEVNGSFTYSLHDKELSASIYYKYTGKTPLYIMNTNDEIQLSETSGFHWADVTVQKGLTRWVGITLGAKNILSVTRVSSTADTGGTHSGSGANKPVGYGRSYFLALNFKFNK